MRLASASHFLQDDQGPHIATVLNAWLAGQALTGNFPPPSTADAGTQDAGPDASRDGG
jgi:hypothetical protein